MIAAAIMLGFGLWWLKRAMTAREFDPAEIQRGHQSDSLRPISLAALPLIAVIVLGTAFGSF